MNGWIRIRSWHLIRNWTRVDGQATTLCGRTASGEALPVFPNDEKTCETCARLRLRNEATLA